MQKVATPFQLIVDFKKAALFDAQAVCFKQLTTRGCAQDNSCNGVLRALCRLELLHLF